MIELPGLERKFCESEKELSVVNGTRIEGYASLFERIDNGGDVVSKGAYARCLSELIRSGRSVKMLWQHDPREPIGVWDEVIEDDIGLYVRGRLLAELSRAREAAVLIEAGAIDGLSIGYRTRRSARDKSGRRCLSELELWEVSLVTFPMLADARVDAKRQHADTLHDLAVAIEDARQLIAAV